MILADQPTCFPDDVLVRVSSRTDGTMLDRSLPIDDESIVANRQAFCQANGIVYEDVAYQRVVYAEDASYELTADADSRSTVRHTSGVIADALFTETRGVGLFLPVADCVPLVIFDPSRRYLALLHMGRHSTMSNLLPKMIGKFVARGSRADDLFVWMGPSAGRASYKLEHFTAQDDPKWFPYRDIKTDGTYIDMQGYNRQRCIDAGLREANLYLSHVDTMVNDNYFSHAAGDSHGRMAVVAIMR